MWAVLGLRQGFGFCNDEWRTSLTTVVLPHLGEWTPGCLNPLLSSFIRGVAPKGGRELTYPAVDGGCLYIICCCPLKAFDRFTIEDIGRYLFESSLGFTYTIYGVGGESSIRSRLRIGDLFGVSVFDW